MVFGLYSAKHRQAVAVLVFASLIRNAYPCCYRGFFNKFIARKFSTESTYAMRNFFRFYWRHIMVMMLSFIMFFVVIVSFISIATQHNYFYRIFLGKNVTDLLGIISLSISFTAFFSIIFSLQQTIHNRQNELKQITVDMFKELRGQHFRQVRSRCWEVKEKWDEDENSDGYRDRLINAMFSDSSDSTITSEHTQAIYDLIGFYTILSLYRGNENDIRHLNYFYYGWWRKFLYELAEYKDLRRVDYLFDDSELTNHEFKFDKQGYIDNVTLKPVLKRLDILCGFENLPGKLNMHKSGG